MKLSAGVAAITGGAATTASAAASNRDRANATGEIMSVLPVWRLKLPAHHPCFGKFERRPLGVRQFQPADAPVIDDRDDLCGFATGHHRALIQLADQKSGHLFIERRRQPAGLEDQRRLFIEIAKLGIARCRERDHTD